MPDQNMQIIMLILVIGNIDLTKKISYCTEEIAYQHARNVRA